MEKRAKELFPEANDKLRTFLTKHRLEKIQGNKRAFLTAQDESKIPIQKKLSGFVTEELEERLKDIYKFAFPQSI